MERQLITGIAHDKNEAKITLTRVPDRPGAVAHIFGPLADAAINVDMIIQNVGRDKGETDVTFTVPGADLARALDVLEGQKDVIGFNRIIPDTTVGRSEERRVGKAGVSTCRARWSRDH